MNTSQWLGVIRHGLTFAGAILITKGIISESAALDITGAVMTLVGLVWSVIENKTKIG